MQENQHLFIYTAVLSVRFEVGVSHLLAPAGADKRGPKAPFPLVENAGIQLAIRKKVPAGAPAGARSYRKHCTGVTKIRKTSVRQAWLFI